MDVPWVQVGGWHHWGRDQDPPARPLRGPYVGLIRGQVLDRLEAHEDVELEVRLPLGQVGRNESLDLRGLPIHPDVGGSPQELGSVARTAGGVDDHISGLAKTRREPVAKDVAPPRCLTALGPEALLYRWGWILSHRFSSQPARRRSICWWPKIPGLIPSRRATTGSESWS